MAISTDTGCFVYANTTPHTHRVAAALMETGIAVAGVNKALFRTKSRTRLAMEAWMAEWAEYYDNDRVVVMQIPRSLCLDYKATEADVEELSSLAALVAGTDCGVTLRELAVNGNDLKALGLECRQIGDTLRALLEAVVEERLPNNREALLGEVRQHLPRPEPDRAIDGTEA